MICVWHVGYTDIGDIYIVILIFDIMANNVYIVIVIDIE